MSRSLRTCWLFAALAVAALSGIARSYCVGDPNGTVQPGEECDDGNLQNADCCTNECTFPCDDHEFCTVDGCTYSPASGRHCAHDTFLPAGTPCPEGSNPCKVYQCGANGRCGVRLPDGTPCPSDGNACTLDECDRGSCGVDVSCDDDNPCTVDSCNPASGCVHQPLGDGFSCFPDPCHLGQCLAAQCVQVQPKCDDHNSCTTDSCNGDGNCSNVAVPNDTPCDDGDPCTPAGTCSGGWCSGTRCPESGPCSTDGLACDDGDVCSPASVCASERCVAQCPEPCPTDGNACDDLNDCTPSSSCHGGDCTGEGCRVDMPCLACGLICRDDPCRCGL